MQFLCESLLFAQNLLISLLPFHQSMNNLVYIFHTNYTYQHTTALCIFNKDKSKRHTIDTFSIYNKVNLSREILSVKKLRAGCSAANDYADISASYIFSIVMNCKSHLQIASGWFLHYKKSVANLKNIEKSVDFLFQLCYT